jgi:hypothetical protein
MVKYLQTIKEEEEHDQEAAVFTMEMAALGMTPGSHHSPSKYKKREAASVKNSFIGGSFIGGDIGIGIQSETESQRRDREKKELQEGFVILSKEDAKKEMKRKDFDEFLTKTTRIVERALGQNFDVIGDFFAEEEDDANLGQQNKREKIAQAFIFAPNQHLKRMVTSMDWSPKVSELIMVSYSKHFEHKYDEPDGLINIYSTNLKTRPEITLTCQNELTKAIFNPFKPNIVIGAT